MSSGEGGEKIQGNEEMKRPGHCTLCETPVREIVAKHTTGPLKGEPSQLGEWKDNAYRVSYLLSDGSIADITFCENCLDGDFGEIWAAVKDRFMWEEEFMAPQRTPKQQEAVDRELNRVLTLKIEKKVGQAIWKYHVEREKALETLLMKARK